MRSLIGSALFERQIAVLQAERQILSTKLIQRIRESSEKSKLYSGYIIECNNVAEIIKENSVNYTTINKYVDNLYIKKPDFNHLNDLKEHMYMYYEFEKYIQNLFIVSQPIINNYRDYHIKKYDNDMCR